ncbi:hypothetical protein PanWU01x14_333820 [Parasponia andersonii]|uniref:Uncharacterized protein n=1 Tax=Parasponia andersonii TaxID=3476 RepID=A0A2P5AGT1_PARAD|nr:hypothetical protein PanWU01x14_333820 [Parasponia andersonii]
MRGDLMLRPGGVSSLSYSHTTRFRRRALRVLIDGHGASSHCWFGTRAGSQLPFGTPVLHQVHRPPIWGHTYNFDSCVKFRSAI